MSAENDMLTYFSAPDRSRRLSMDRQKAVAISGLLEAGISTRNQFLQASYREGVVARTG